MEHDGFEIEIFNQYELDSTKKVSVCPLCSHTRKKSKDKCMMLDWERGLGTCQHCGEVIQLHKYVSKSEPKDFTPIQLPSVGPNEAIYTYFANRGISKDTVDYFDVSKGTEFMPQVGKEVGVILFRYKFKGQTINVKYRDRDKNFKMYKGAKKTLYNIDSIIDQSFCVIVEGEVDAMSFHEAGVAPVVSVPNGFNAKGQINLDYLNDIYYLLEPLERVYLCVDNDEAGENGKKELVRRLGAEKVWLCDLEDCKDANEYIVKYGKEKLHQIIINAQPYPIENVLRVRDIEEDLDDFYKNGSKKGYVIGLEEFDKIFSTYTKQFIVVTGFPSSGKSDFVDQMTIGYNMMYKWKTAYASTENYPYHLHVDKLIRKLYGATPTYQDTKEVAWTKCKNHINDNFFFIDFEDGFSLDKVLAKGQELVRRMGIRCLVIDPYNKIRDKENVNLSITDYTNAYLNKIDAFCKRNDVLVILVAHPTKPDKSKEGNLLEPTFYDVKGGGEFYDMSPHGILVHRDYNNSTVKVKVLKVKFGNLGENQAEKLFMWNVSNGRYTQCQEAGNDGHGKAYAAKWDNTNWLSSSSNPFIKTQSLDLDFRDLLKTSF